MYSHRLLQKARLHNFIYIYIIICVVLIYSIIIFIFYLYFIHIKLFIFRTIHECIFTIIMFICIYGELLIQKKIMAKFPTS